jgi:hypothetical protein
VTNKKKTTLPNTPGRQAAQKKYNSKPEQVKNREERNRARAKLMKQGKVHKGDGKDVDHIAGTAAGNSDSNLRVLSASVNRHYNRRSKKTKAPKKL